MFRYNPAANYQPNGGRYLQILSGKDFINKYSCECHGKLYFSSEISEYFC